MNYESVIGLEVHVQLATKTKLFCGCKAEFGAEPNANTCPVCLGWPGSLPVLNEEALHLAIKAGLALNCEVSGRLKFDRKNYFYPDLPKAYQISQYDQPVNGRGWLDLPETQREEEGRKREEGRGKREETTSVLLPPPSSHLLLPSSLLPPPSGNSKRVGITRAHLEEDAGKLLHEGVRDGSLVDYNRAGTPLLEIVSEPDLRSPEEAYAYLTALKAVLQYLEVSDCNMEEGSLRCDANVSLRPAGAEKLGTKTEIKNLNSFRAVERAIAYEIRRQTEVLESGDKVVQATRLWDEKSGTTKLMRTKEEAHDYRYFPEPDLVPFSLPRERIETLRRALPELPQARLRRFIQSFGLSPYDASVLVQDKKLGDYFEECVGRSGTVPHEKPGTGPAGPVPFAKLASNWIQSELLGLLGAARVPVQESPVSPGNLAGLIRLIESGTISGKLAKEILPLMFQTGKTADTLVKEKGLQQMSDSKLLEDLADRVIAAHPQSVADFKSGKKQALGFLVGQIMKETQGKANPQLVNDLLRKKLS